MADNKDIQTLATLLKGVAIAMLTTADPEGRIKARPMMAQDAPFDGDLWFLTARSTSKMEEIGKWPQVNVSFAKPGDGVFISVSGKAEIVEDSVKKRALWRDAYKVWFPGGVDDPELVLLKVAVYSAEYWKPPATTAQALSFLKAIATGAVSEKKTGENAEIVLRDEDSRVSPRSPRDRA